MNIDGQCLLYKQSLQATVALSNK